MEAKFFTKFKELFISFMTTDSSRKFLENLSDEQKNISSRIFDLVIGRVLKRAYLGLDEESRREMESIFLSDDEGAKKIFIERLVPNFKSIFEEETKKVEEEIRLEIEKRV